MTREIECAEVEVLFEGAIEWVGGEVHGGHVVMTNREFPDNLRRDVFLR
jgi:hypothetical protein